MSNDSNPLPPPPASPATLPAPSPAAPGPIALLMRSRKGMLVALVLVVALSFTAAVVLQAVRGRMSIESAFAFVSGAIVGWVLVVVRAIGAIADEDNAARQASAELAVAKQHQAAATNTATLATERTAMLTDLAHQVLPVLMEAIEKRAAVDKGKPS